MLKRIEQIHSLLRFRLFERRITRHTRARHDQVLKWVFEKAAQSEADDFSCFPDSSNNPLVTQGQALVRSVKESFAGKYTGYGDRLRILIHVPSAKRSPAGYSLFLNLAASLQFIGVPTRCLAWEESLRDQLLEFRPTVLLSSDSAEYLARLDLDAVRQYRVSQVLKLGLTASLEEYGNTPLPPRLKWAVGHGIDFYYSFKAPEYLTSRKEYRPFYENGYSILSVEFGANPLLYHPIAGVTRDIDFVFLASRNADKRERYYAYLPGVFRHGQGLWAGITPWVPPAAQRFLYARAKVGINLHIDNSLDWPSELNERTYILAACGVPQLIDDAKLLPFRFSPDAMFVAKTPAEYTEMFSAMLKNPALTEQRALKAQQEVFAKYTTFHRAESLATALWHILDHD
jgi:hypothetical protein